jgi:hypothetical protein
MMEAMAARVEVWPVAADELGVWLVSGDDAWRPDLPVMADNEPHFTAEMELSRHGALEPAVLLHSTSWRVDGPAIVLTYLAVIGVEAYVRDAWPAARPVSLKLAQRVGKPHPHAAIDPPTPRYIDVLLHGLRHLRFLLDTDTSAADALTDSWPTHLRELEPALAGMYGEVAETA